MNRFYGIGRLTRDPEVRYSSGENASVNASFTLAIDRKFKQKDGEGVQADFLRCVAFGKTAETVERYLKKGLKIAVEGRIQTGSYKNRDGNTVYTTDVVVESIEFLEKASGGETKKKDDGVKDGADGFISIPDGIEESLPFI